MKRLERVVPQINVSAGKLLSLAELAKAKDAAICRSSHCFRRWIEYGVAMPGVIVHLPHIRIGRHYFSSVSGLTAFLQVLQDISHANTARMADQLGRTPVTALRGDVFEKGGR
jgi:hypothetical protein